MLVGFADVMERTSQYVASGKSAILTGWTLEFA